jgi:demethylmenaquinone methyltransferase/2-methoxy-6-polyprenyl-1,4-benzoquinol methylase
MRKTQVTSVVGLDFTRAMLPLAIEKARSKGLGDRIDFVAGDAHALPFSDNEFICATVGFGVRNFIDVPLALSEMRRVVKPGGRVVVLEIVRQDGFNPVGKLFPAYFRRVTPLMGALFAGDREAYTYLPESVQGFISASELMVMMERAGLVNVRCEKLALGTVAIHVGEKSG